MSDRAYLGIRYDDPSIQAEFERLRQAIRDAEQARAPRVRKEKDADTVALERALTEALGLVVQIEHRGENGEVRIRYKTLEQLDALCRRLNA